MANATSVKAESARQQLPGVFENIWEVNALMSIAILADGVGETNTIAVPGVKLGDMVVAASLDVSLQGMTLTGYVSAANVVTLRFQNESGASTTAITNAKLKMVVGRASF